jgi:hypothetical protein
MRLLGMAMRGIELSAGAVCSLKARGLLDAVRDSGARLSCSVARQYPAPMLEHLVTTDRVGDAQPTRQDNLHRELCPRGEEFGGRIPVYVLFTALPVRWRGTSHNQAAAGNHWLVLCWGTQPIPVRTTYQRLIQPPPPTRRLTQPPPPPPLIQPPPRTGPLRLTQPAAAFGEEASQAPAPTAARIAAPDHFPMLRRNNRRCSNSVSVIAAFSLDDPLLIGKIFR